MDEIDIKFSVQEVAVLRQLLNAAVMARGMEAAEAALVLDRKIVAAMNAYGMAKQAKTGGANGVRPAVELE